MLSDLVPLALFSVGFTHVTRALAPITWRLVKPVGCSLCMSFWPSAILGGSGELAKAVDLTAFLMALPTTVILVLGSTGLAFGLNKAIDWGLVHLD